MRILALDPGEKNIGVAISDPSGTIASPLVLLKHFSRSVDAASIASLVEQYQAEMLVIGKSPDENGDPTPQSRRADRLADAIRQQCNVAITMWDESFSTQEAQQTRISIGISRKKRRGHIDNYAAAVILQDYLDHGNQP